MTILQRGSTGPEVKELQIKLQALGFKLGDADGEFGPSTEAAVKKFQKVKGLKADGRVGERTMSVFPSSELDLPLHLFEVLEEEHISLHRYLQQQTRINLKNSESKNVQAENGQLKDGGSKKPESNGREVTSCLDWDFHTGHIKDWKEFQKHLLDSSLTDPERECPEKRTLRKWRKGKDFSIRHLKDLLTREKVSKWDTEDAASATLNQLLGERFYCRDDFRHVKFTESTEKLFELYPSKDRGRRIFPDELRQMNRLLLEDLFPEHLESIKEIRLAAIYQVRHEGQVPPKEEVSAALCLSGGGIRSGTFGLGLLQGLARHNLLNEFDYLSTVSGGGYIGAWLTAWIHRHPKPHRGLEGVTDDLRNARPGKKIDPDPPALRHLREYSNFLTPKAGLLSADTWSFLAIYLRNLMLNWSVIIPLLLAFLLIPRLSVAVVLAAHSPSFKVFLLLAGCLLVVWATVYIGLSRPSLRPKLIENTPSLKDKMGQGGFLWHGLFPLVLAGSLLTTYLAWTPENLADWRPFVLSGAALAALALSLSTVVVADMGEILLDGFLLILTSIFVALLVITASGNVGYEWLFFVVGAVVTLWRLVVVLWNRRIVIGGWNQKIAVGGWKWKIGIGAVLMALTGIFASRVVRNAWDGWLLLGAGGAAVALLILVAVFFRNRKVVIDGWKRKTVMSVALLILIGIFATLFVWVARNSWDGWLLLSAGGAAVTSLILIADAGNKKEIIGGAILILTGIFVGLLIWAAAGLMGNQTRVGNIDDSWATELYVSYAVPIFLLLFMLAATVFAGISSHLLGIVTEEDREWWARFSAWTLISAGAWALFSTLVIFGPLGLLEFPRLLAAVGGISGIVALVLGKSANTAATSEKVAQGGWRAYLSSYLLPILAILFLAVFVSALSLLTSTLTPWTTSHVDSALARTSLEAANRLRLDAPFTPNTNPGVEQPALPVEISNTKIGDLLPVPKSPLLEQRQPSDAKVQHMRAIHFPRWGFFLGLMVALSIVGFLLARFINLNLFSLHNSYRTRLIRGFLAASRERKLRRPNPFTGFDAADNVSMHELRPALLHEVDFKDLDGFANQLKTAGQTLANRPDSSDSDKNAPSAQSLVIIVDPLDSDKHVASGTPTNASEFLYAQLSEKGKAAVDENELPTPLAPNQRADLIEDLNRILEADQILLEKAPGFADPVAADAEQQVGPAPSTEREYHIYLNRMALESKYGDFIETCDYPPHRLLHVVNTTLNLVGGDNLAWQQRKAESFTVSPLHCGSYRVGYRRSRDYGGDDGISLGTAMAISGAAASSNMGYYTTSPVLSLVLTLFNVRLGWWLGNPGPAGSQSYIGTRPDDRLGEGAKKIYRRMSPTLSVGPVFSEAFGLTDDRSKYVYLTDGGHFENLGLYEMVLRRCHLIVVSDAAADANYEFNDLANAVRKVRIDLGIHIEFPDVPIYNKKPDKAEEGGCYWSVGLIRYSDIDYKADGKQADDGILIYIKPAVYDDEPEDVMHYKRTHPDFPNETTADQFFDEPQFESYRALGSYIMDKMCGSDSEDLTLDQFVSQVKMNFFQLAPQAKKKYGESWDKTTRVGRDATENKNLRDACFWV